MSAASQPLTSIASLREHLVACGARPVHVAHLLRAWLNARPLDACRGKAPEHYLPLAVRRVWPEIEQGLNALTRVVSEHAGADGSVRMLLELHDAQTVESVLLPPRDAVNVVAAREGAVPVVAVPVVAARDGAARHVAATRAAQGLCVSTQVGCAVGCTFCKTGEGGLARQMGSAEIAAQLALARTRRTVNKIVFMGMGEPAHNLDAVLEAIDVFGDEGGIGHKNLVLSTVGDTRLFDRLLERAARRQGMHTREGAHTRNGAHIRKGEGEGEGASSEVASAAHPDAAHEVLPALALSLHSTDDARRRSLLPHAPRLPVADLLAQADHYARATGYPLQIQWTLIDSVNDGDDEIEGLVALLRGRYAILNMIPYNHVDNFTHRRPTAARCDAMFHALNRRGVRTRMRQSAGQDVEAGCGQLRSRAVTAATMSFSPRVSSP